MRYGACFLLNGIATITSPDEIGGSDMATQTYGDMLFHHLAVTLRKPKLEDTGIDNRMLDV